jgi:hypothetical protein
MVKKNNLLLGDIIIMGILIGIYLDYDGVYIYIYIYIYVYNIDKYEHIHYIYIYTQQPAIVG